MPAPTLPLTPATPIAWPRLVCCLLLLAGLLGVGGAWAEVKLPNGEYTESHADLTVKVLGGSVTLTRTWINGRWYLNPAWASLRFIRDPLDNSVKAIDRAGSLYVRDGEIYVFDGVLGSRRYLQATDSGWQWRDGSGNWIDYDGAGSPTRYGDRNQVQVRFVLDADGRRQEVRDHQDRLVMRFGYQDGRLSEAQDRAGHTVHYGYDGDRLVQVTDAAGQTWRYAYDNQGQLTKRTDPAGGEFKIFYPESTPAGAFAMDGDRARPVETPVVATTGLPERDIRIARVGTLTDEAGRVTTYQYQYDRQTRQYRITTLPPGGPTQVDLYDRDGRLLERTLRGERQRRLTQDKDRLEIETDARGLETHTQYDADLRPLSITYPDGTRETFA